MQTYFYQLADKIFSQLSSNSVLLLSLYGEQSEFVRLNQSLIRQAGSVNQNTLTMTLIEKQKQASASFELSSHTEQDFKLAEKILTQLQQQLAFLPDDPYLNFATDVNSTEHIVQHDLPKSHDALDHALELAHGLDLVGIWATGNTYSGFANSLGQKNWHCQNSFNFDWSVYHSEDKAVKCDYAGFKWAPDVLQNKIQQNKQALEILKHPNKTLTPGKYRTYLSPSANRELLDMMSWGGFGLKSHKTQHTPLVKMVTESWRLDPRFTLAENHHDGLTPDFTHHGYIKPKLVELIEQGKYESCLVNPRSAKEFSEQVNCDHEHPESLQLSPGSLKEADILTALDTGLYINNLWYCNFSDHNHCRITGMTRFACFWVENGEITAPINVMRFDDSIYNIFGKNLVNLTETQETIFDAGTYDKRSATSYKVPGSLVDDFTLTL